MLKRDPVAGKMAQWVQALAAKPDKLRSLGPRGTHKGGKEATVQLSSDLSAHTCACTHERKVVRHILVGFQACSSPQRHPRQPENWGRQTTPTSTYRLLVPPADSITTQGGGGLPILLKGSYVQALKNAQVRATAHRCPRH